MGLYRIVTPVPRRAAAVGINGPFNLSVNPVSYALLHLDGVVAAATAVGQNQPFTDLDEIAVTFNGGSVLRLSGEDLRAALVAMGWRTPFVLNAGSAVNGDLVRVTMPIPFSRKRFWSREAFPASRSGELQIELTFAAQGATFQTRNFTIEVVELLDARPDGFVRMTTKSRALTVGDEDVELPKGNDYVGILIFEPAVADAGITSGTIREVKLLIENVEFGIAQSRFEALRHMLEQRGAPITGFTPDDLPQLSNYAYIDFDPLQDDSFLLPTLGRSSVLLRPTLDNAGTIRVIPIERVKVEGGGAPAMAG